MLTSPTPPLALFVFTIFDGVALGADPGAVVDATAACVGNRRPVPVVPVAAGRIPTLELDVAEADELERAPLVLFTPPKPAVVPAVPVAAGVGVIPEVGTLVVAGRTADVDEDDALAPYCP